MRRLSLLVLLAAVAVGCSPPSRGGVCDDVTCGDNETCDSSTGTCIASSSDGGSDACGGCSGATPVCDTATKSCVRCTATAGCSGRTGICDTSVAGGVCVQCLSDDTCPAAAPTCHPDNRICVACLDDSDCGGAAPVCDDATGLCARCTSERGCSGATPACDTDVPGGACVGCVDDGDCGGATPACDPVRAVCVGCASSAHCGGATPICDNTTATCATCSATQGCGGSTPVCDTSVAGGLCVGCVDASDCGGTTPICDQSTRRCIGCRGPSDCGGSTPICGANQTCVACTALEGCSGETPLCDLSVAGGRCVGCVVDTHCSNGKVCDPVSARCVTCAGDDDCTGGLHCLTSTPGGRCVGCRTDGDCTSGKCDPVGNTCVQCRTSADCANPTPACEAGSCRACTVNSECSPGLVCEGGGCTSRPENCGSARTVTFAPGESVARFTVDTTGAVDDLDGSCNIAARGPELVYRVALPSPSDVVVTAARNATGTANPVLYVRSSCGGTDLACSDSTGGAGATETVTLYNRANEVFFVVETYGASAGPVDVVVTLSPPTVPPSNDECGTATALTFDATGFAAAPGNTTLATNSTAGADLGSTCSYTSQATGRDVVFVYELTTAKDVYLSVDPGTVGGGLIPLVAVRPFAGCADSTTELVCGYSGFQEVARARVLNQQPGRYAVWVDSGQESKGRFTLSVQLAGPTLPPPNEDCATAASLPFNGNGVATTTGNIAVARNDTPSGVAPSCVTASSVSGSDAVHSFTLNQAQDVLVRVTPIAPSNDWKPVAYLRPLATCTSLSSADELACSATSAVGGIVETRSYNVPAGTYALWVDSGASGGGYQLDVLLSPASPPPTNDTCAAPMVIAIGADGTGTATGNTALATNGYATEGGPSCSAGAQSIGKDVVFTYDLAATIAPVTVTVTPRSGSPLKPVLSVRDGASCASVAGQRACVAGVDAGGPVANAFATLAAGRYAVHVDSADRNGGEFRVDVRAGLPPNESCTNARVLELTTPTIDRTIVDSTEYATNDYGRANYGNVETCRRYEFDAGDLVYRYTAATTGQRRVTLRPDGEFDGALLRLEGSACAPASCVEGKDPGGAGDVETMTFNAVAGATYWFVVDGFQSEAKGSFALTIE